MSQYPSPYFPPNVMPHYGAAPPTAMGPARRASILMFILAPFMLVCGGVIVSMPAWFPAILSTMPPAQATQMKQQLNQKLEDAQMSSESFAVVMITEGSLILGPGLILLVLAFFVRRGGKTPVVLSLVVVGLILMFSGLSVLSVLIHPAEIANICIVVPVIAIFGLLFAWLLKAARASSTVSQAQLQYQAQYWQYQQNMQAYMAYQQQQAPASGYPTLGYPQAPPPLQAPLPQMPPTPPPVDPNAPPSA